MKEHTQKGMDMLVLHDVSEAVYVSNLTKFVRDAEADRQPKDWLGYCLLPWTHRMLPVLVGSKVWRNAIKLERRH